MSYLFIQISSGPDDKREKFDNVGVGAHHPEPDADTTVTLEKKIFFFEVWSFFWSNHNYKVILEIRPQQPVIKVHSDCYSWLSIKKCLTTVTQVFFYYQEGILVDHRAYKPYTLVGPPALWLVLDPLAVIFLDNRLYMWYRFHYDAITNNYETILKFKLASQIQPSSFHCPNFIALMHGLIVTRPIGG